MFQIIGKKVGAKTPLVRKEEKEWAEIYPFSGTLTQGALSGLSKSTLNQRSLC